MKNNNTDFSARTKISRILFLFSFCFLFLQSYSANIETYNQEKTFTFEMWNKPVKEVLNYIEKNSQFIFFYYNNTIDIKRNVSLSVKDKPITFVLDQLFKGMDVRYEIKDRQISLKKNEGQQYPQSKKQQKRKLIGTVMDASTDDLLVGVSISVKGTPGVGTITDSAGKFSIEVSNNTELEFSYIGYKTEVQPYHPTLTFHLLPDTQLMQEVTISARRPMIEVGPNGLKANVAGTSLARMGSAAEMLPHLPFVTGHNGEYNVMGCGSPVIYINNKKVRDMTELDRIRANEILSAEVITTPGAEYASDVAAVIRLRTIRRRGQGLSGHFNTTYSQGHSANANEYMALNYRTGGLDLFVKGYMAQQNSYGKTTNMNRIKGSAIWQTNKNDVQTHKSQRFSGELGFNYEPDEHHSFGLRYMPETGIGNADRNSSGRTVTRRNDEETDRINFTTAEQIHTGWDHAANAYYAGELGKWNIDFNADYLFKRSHSDQNAMNNDDATVQADSRMRSSLYAAKLVVSAPLWNGRFSFGTEETFTNRHDIFTQNGFSADADDHIKQSVYAAFADYSRSIRHWKLNMGIRYEHQQTDYYEKGIRIDAQSPTYNDIIPVLAASWSHNGKSFSLSYRLRKNNPDYSLLTNSIRYRSKYEYSQGNPLLKTQKTHRFSAGASWNWLYFSAYFSRILNMYTNIIMPYKEDTHPGVLLFATQTIPTTHNYGISFNASPKLGCWEPQLNVNMAFLDMNANKIGITEHRNQPRFYISLDNNFNLPKGWFFNMEGYLSTASRQGFFVTRTEGQINARLSKSFLKETLTITFTANDILRTGYFHFDLYGIDAYMENRIYRDFQRFGLQVSYKFNATKSKYKGTGAGQSEKNRL